jgi:hypothetical protein
LFKQRFALVRGATMGIMKKAAYAAVIFGAGYFACKYKEPVSIVTEGVYNRVSVCVDKTWDSLYDWSTQSKLEQKVQTPATNPSK